MPASTPMLKRTPVEVVVEVVVDGVIVCAFAVNANAVNAKAIAEIFNEFFMMLYILNCRVFLNTGQSNVLNHLSFFILMSALFNRLINKIII